MINVNDFKPGISFAFNNNIYLVLEALHSKSGRGQAHVKTKVKNLRTQATTTITFTGGEKVSRAHLEKRKMQYLYREDNNFIFMDKDNFEQISINVDKLKWEANFLTDGLIVQVINYNGEILGVIMPDKVNLKIIETELAIKGNSVNAATKKAKLETGWEVQVPLFINNDEIIIVSTSDGKYDQRA